MAASQGDAVPATPQPIEQPTQALPVSAVPAPANPTVLPSNLPVGIAMGTLFGLLAAILSAVIAIAAEREFALGPLLIGFGIAFGFGRFGHTRGLVPGAIAVAIALVLFFLAVFLESAGSIAKYFEASYIDGLRAAVESPGDVVSSYFSSGPAYLFLALTVGFAFYYANGGKFLVLNRGFAFDYTNGGKAAKAKRAAPAHQQRAVTNDSLKVTQNETSHGA